jgi:hypothetical protein
MASTQEQKQETKEEDGLPVIEEVPDDKTANFRSAVATQLPSLAVLLGLSHDSPSAWPDSWEREFRRILDEDETEEQKREKKRNSIEELD